MEQESTSVRVTLGEHAVDVLGVADENLKALAELTDLDIFVRGDAVVLTGSVHEIGRVRALLKELVAQVKRGHVISPDTVKHTCDVVSLDTSRGGVLAAKNIIERAGRGKNVRPKTLGQQKYVEAIDANTIVFGVGPAGSGKTYLAVAKAVQALKAKEVSRIILTRPAVEAGEKLGFLPGTLNDKIDPYLRPLHDALRDMMDAEAIPRLLESGIIEVAPLAYMRGRTLNDAFVILDEAQNTTPEQMKMFLTRLGFGTKMVVTGDVTQVDLPRGQRSGLRVVRDILEGIEGMYWADLSADDVVRHHLVSAIVRAYDRAERENRLQHER